MARRPSEEKRLYRAWKGSNKFFCGGRLIFGPDVGSLFLSSCLIAAPLVALCCQVIIKVHHVGMSDENWNIRKEVLGYPVLIVTIIIGLADLIFLFMTSSRDPGIVPRNSRPPESDEAFDHTTPSMEWVNATSPNLRLPRTKDVNVNGFIVKVKYCDTCLLYRPPRTSHCSICNNCVQKFDHHCPWVGQCIGLRNYRYYFLFISTSTFLCIYVFAISWLNIIVERKNHHNSLLKSITGEVLSLVLLIYAFICVWFVGGLTAFHLFLISTNQTTYENFRYRYDKKENPYNKGLLRNFAEVFISKIPTSSIKLRSWVAVGDTTESVSVITSAAGRRVTMSKDKIDLELGSISAMDGSMPSILRGVDYSSSLENSMQGKGTHGVDGSDPFAFPVIQHTNDQATTMDSAYKNIKKQADATTASLKKEQESASAGLMITPDRQEIEQS